MINFNKAEYVKSAYYKKDLINNNFPQFVFAGRSNVGKSSLINTLLNKKKLVLISKQPGKTKTINYFVIDNKIYFVDLPGYGFAKVSNNLQQVWRNLIEYYLLNTKEIRTIFLLWDIRNAPAKNDMLMLEWILEHRLPFQIILTKVDKLSNNEINKKILSLQKEYNLNFSFFLFSSKTKFGKKEVLDYITIKYKGEI